MFRRFASLGIISTLGAAVVAFGCSANGDGTGSSKGSGGGGAGTSTNAGGNGQGGGIDCFPNCNTGSGGNPNVQALNISPMNPTLQVVNGTIPTQTMTVTTQAGQDVTNLVTWVYERPDVGDMVGATFKPTGNAGGVGVLTAKYSGAEATTNVTVSVKKTDNQAGVDPNQEMAFENPVGEDPSLSLLYPFNETVFPLGVLAPEMQWNGGQANDTYRLKITEKFMEYVVYFKTSTPARFLMKQADWVGIGASGTGANSDPLKVVLSRMSNGQVYSLKEQTWHVAQGKVRGAIYYWELPDACGSGSGRILKIKPDTDVPEEFFTPGGCYGCHTVSRDGTNMMATLDTGVPFPQITINLAANPVVMGSITQAAGLGGTFSAFNDKGDRIAVSNDAASNPSGALVRIADGTTGAILNGNAMGAGCGEPAWSPDGTTMSAICGLSGGGWIFDATGGYLATADVAADGISVSNVKSIVPQAGAQGRPAYPSFTSDSKYLIFGRPTAGSRSTGNGDLWMVNKDGSELKKLAIAASDNQSFNPVVAPQRAGGFYWVVFISRRDYGNTLVGASRQQLWMTAIDDPPIAADPSHPPFYVRGQENCGKSENAYMAQEPCKAIGQSCESGADCCNGQCVNMGGMYVCGEPPPPGMCSQTGNSCKTSADCCNPTDTCTDGFCAGKIPK